MPLLRRTDHAFRLIATIMLVCYSFVGMALSFQHTDCGLNEQELFAQLPRSVAQPSVAADSTTAGTGASKSFSSKSSKETHISSSCKATHRSHHCVACEWQANNVSVALPTFTLVLISIRATRAITTFPRSFHIYPVHTSSRAPPLA